MTEKVAYDQIQEYFEANGLNTIYQHAYRSGHSTTEMTDYWLEENDKSLVGTGFLDLNLTFDVLDHNILIKKIVFLWI